MCCKDRKISGLIKERVKNIEKKKPGPFCGKRTGFTINLSIVITNGAATSIGTLELCDRARGVIAGFAVGNYRTTNEIQIPGGFCRVFGRRPVPLACEIIETILFVFCK